MDIVLEFVDTFIADYVYAYLFPIGCTNKPGVNDSAQMTNRWTWQPASKNFHIQPSPAAYLSSMTRDNLCRQVLTIYFIAWLFGVITYFIFATCSYYLIFDKRATRHPKYMKNQIWLEIKMSNQSLPIIAILFTPLFLLEARGYSKLYDTTADGPGWWYDVLQIPLFLIFSDFYNYWLHRFAHQPRVYKHFLYAHKLHHRFIVTTPFSSYALHPMEGFAQAFPYRMFAFILPLRKVISIGLLVFLTLWSIGVHDGGFLVNNPIVNGAACHSLHHVHRDCNYGQYFTLFDRLHGTYRKPENLRFRGNDDPLIYRKENTF